MTSTLWSNRQFIVASIARDFRARYQHSILGALWTVVQPLAMILVYTIIFSQIMQAKLPGVDHAFAYSVYLCSGIITWGLFSEISSRLQNVYLENANLIKKIRFPKLCLVTVVVGTACINFTLIFCLFLGFLLLTGTFPGLVIVAIIPLLAILIFFAVSLGLILGTLNVFFRDVGHFFGIFLTFWFWFTPIVYPISIIPSKFHWVLAINPLFHVMTAIQEVMVMGRWPAWEWLLIPLGVASLLAVFGYRLFQRVHADLVDTL